MALALVTLVLSVVTPIFSSSRHRLDELAGDLESSLRFAVDESILRNSMVRLHLLMDKNPQEYAIEYGPSGSFVLPSNKLASNTSRSLREEEEYQGQVEELNKKFHKVKEFNEKNKTVDESLIIIGVGNSDHEQLITVQETALYVYPSGEKDDAIIILGSEDEILSLEMSPFTSEIKRTYQTIDPNETDEIEEIHLKMAQELFTNWRKSK